MTHPQLLHTEAVRALIDAGRRDKAVTLHNAHVEQQFKTASAGATISLTDLMAAHEALVVAAWNAGRSSAKQREA